MIRSLCAVLVVAVVMAARVACLPLLQQLRNISRRPVHGEQILLRNGRQALQLSAVFLRHGRVKGVEVDASHS